MKRTLKTIGAVLLCTAVNSFIPKAAFADAHVWTGNGINRLFSNPQNWKDGKVPSPAEPRPIHLGFAEQSGLMPHYDPIIDILGLPIDSMSFPGKVDYTFSSANGAKLHLSDATVWVITPAEWVPITVNLTFESSLEVALTGTNHFSTKYFKTNTTTNIRFEGPITGLGSLRLGGYSEFWFSGTANNTYSGPTRLSHGNLHLDRNGGVAVAGDLFVNIGTVFQLRDHQIANTASVEIHSDVNLPAAWLLSGHDEAIGALTLRQAQVYTGAGVLTVNGPITSSPSANFLFNIYNSLITGRLSLGTLVDPAIGRVFDVSHNLDVPAVITGNSGVILRKQGEAALRLLGTNTFAGQTVVDDGVLHVMSSNALGAASAGTVVHQGATLKIENSIDVLEPLTLAGAGSNDHPAALWLVSGNTVCSNLVLASDAVVNVSAGVLHSQGVISGSAGLTKIGPGSLQIAGTAANTFTGETVVEDGLMTLAKTAGLRAVGSLSIGNATVSLINAGQIADAAPVTIASGLLNLNGRSDTIGSLTLKGGSVTTGAGLLTLGGNLVCPDGSGASDITGNLSLGASGRTIYVGAATPFATVLAIDANLGGGASVGFTKSGVGELSLAGLNTFSGFVVVSNGAIRAQSSTAFGSVPSGVYLQEGTELILDGNLAVGNENLVCNGGSVTVENGNASWAGAVTLNSNAVITVAASRALTLSGAISGPGGIIKEGAGALHFTGSSPNIHQGETSVAAGSLFLNKTGSQAVGGRLVIGSGRNHAANSILCTWQQPEQVADSAEMFLHPSGRAVVSGQTETIGALNGSGNVAINSAQLNLGGDGMGAGLFSGTLSGAGGIVQKLGNGTLTLTGANSHSGGLYVNGGLVLVNGSQADTPVSLSSASAKVGGNGSVGNVTANNGLVTPGNSPGILHVKNALLGPNGTLRAELNGLAPGVNCDLLDVIGTVTLNNAKLSATIGFSSAVSNQFVVIQNDGTDAVAGTFLNLPEGGAVAISGAQFKISYTGGDGNDVVLTQTTVVPQPTNVSLQRLPGGQIQVTGKGVPGNVYSVQANADLNTTNWIVIGSATGGLNGNMQFTDPDAPSFAIRFYRFAFP